MPTRLSARRLVLATIATVAIASIPAAAQGHGTAMKVSTGDSVSFIVPRRGPREGEASLQTRDRGVSLILRDTVVVIQLTDRGMDRIFESDTATREGGDAILAKMMKAGIAAMLDHGIAYRLSALRDARAEGTTLVLEDRKGEHVFEKTEFNGKHPMREFDAGEAERFAALVRRAMTARR